VEAESLQLAAHHILDALHGRDAHGLVAMHAASRHVRRCFHVQTAAATGYLFVAVALAHALAAIYEDVSPAAGLAVGAAACVVYALDLGLKVRACVSE
jgi:hypothetical protein